MRQSNTTFVNLRAALDDIEPLIDTAKPATKDLAPFLRELRPVFQKLVPFTRNLRLVVRRPGKGNDAADLLATLPKVQELASNAFPHSEQAISDFQPNLNFIRAYTPDLFNGFAKLGQVAGYYDGNGHYVRAATAAQNLFNYNASSSELEPIGKAQQYEQFGTTEVHTRCPGGATQPAADGSSPSSIGGGSGVDRRPNATPPTCPPAHEQTSCYSPAAAGGGDRRDRPGRLRRRRLERRLQGAGDLRQRRLHGQRRGSARRRRHRRRDRIGRRLDARRERSPTKTASRSKSRARRSSS